MRSWKRERHDEILDILGADKERAAFLGDGFVALQSGAHSRNLFDAFEGGCSAPRQILQAEGSGGRRHLLRAWVAVVCWMLWPPLASGTILNIFEIIYCCVSASSWFATAHMEAPVLCFTEAGPNLAARKEWPRHFAFDRFVLRS